MENSLLCGKRKFTILVRIGLVGEWAASVLGKELSSSLGSLNSGINLRIREHGWRTSGNQRSRDI